MTIDVAEAHKEKFLDTDACVLYMRRKGIRDASLYWVRKMISDGIPKRKIGKRWYITQTDIDQWLLRAKR